MKKRIALLIALLIMLTGAATLADAAELSVRGTGIVSLDADTATIMLGVREVSRDVSTAQATVNEKIAGVIQTIRDMGIAVDDIHTSSITIYPEYNYDDGVGRVVGYTAENAISVRTTDTENVGKYIDAAFEAGANIFSDIRFSASDTTAENSQALALAIRQAFDKAQIMADAAGMKLGALESVTEADYSYQDSGALYDKVQAAEGAPAGTEVYASKLQVSATVTARFALEPVE